MSQTTTINLNRDPLEDGTQPSLIFRELTAYDAMQLGDLILGQEGGVTAKQDQDDLKRCLDVLWSMIQDWRGINDGQSHPIAMESRDDMARALTMGEVFDVAMQLRFNPEPADDEKKDSESQQPSRPDQ
jgi:hypothetical protein